jgi:cytochrome c oxidase subunit 1
VTTFPWHWVGILGMPRRMAFYDFSDPAISPQAIYVTLSAIGGLILLASGLLFLFILARGQRAEVTTADPYTFARPVHEPAVVPAPLNGYALWLSLMVALTITNYGFPILQLASGYGTSVPAVYVGR